MPQELKLIAAGESENPPTPAHLKEYRLHLYSDLGGFMGTRNIIGERAFSPYMIIDGMQYQLVGGYENTLIFKQWHATPPTVTPQGSYIYSSTPIFNYI